MNLCYEYKKCNVVPKKTQGLNMFINSLLTLNE